MSFTETGSWTYTEADIEAVARRFAADIVMIAQSSRGMTEILARDHAHDVEALAKKGYLTYVDVTLFSGSPEIRATKYTVNTEAGSLTMSRPGGVRWPVVAFPELRVVVGYASTYDSIAEASMRGKLRLTWYRTNTDTRHVTLTPTGGRNYASNGWAMQREDFAA